MIKKKPNRSSRPAFANEVPPRYGSGARARLPGVWGGGTESVRSLTEPLSRRSFSGNRSRSGVWKPRARAVIVRNPEPGGGEREWLSGNCRRVAPCKKSPRRNASATFPSEPFALVSPLAQCRRRDSIRATANPFCDGRDFSSKRKPSGSRTSYDASSLVSRPTRNGSRILPECRSCAALEFETEK